jgi:peptidoglycan/LPS O-acetylase OafA/YrhL
MLVALIVCAAEGFVSYRWVEKPLTDRLRLAITAGAFRATPA